MPRELDKLRLRTAVDVFYVASDDGVWLRNSRGSLTIRGPHAYPLVDRLLPSLDGRRPFDEVFGDLAPGPGQVVRRLLDSLLAEGFVQVVPEERTQPPAWVRELYDEQFTFLDHHVSDPAERFAAFRGLRVAVAGTGELTRALVTALCEMGVGKLAVHPSRPGDGLLGKLVEGALVRDRRLSASVRTPAADLAVAIKEAAAAADVVAVADRVAPGQLSALLPEAVTRKVRCALVTTWRGYVLNAGPAGPCPVCMDRALAGVSKAEPNPRVPPAAAAIAAHDLAAGLFLEAVGLPRGPAVASVDTTDLTTRRHEVARHPDCPRCLPSGPYDQVRDEPVRPAIPPPRASAELTTVQDGIVGRIAALTDSVVGPLLDIGEGDLSQLSLAASSCTFRTRDSRSGAPASARLCVLAASAREARNQVVLNAAERWLMAGPLPAAALCAPGAGWSEGEAAYRALAAVSVSWAEQEDCLPTARELSPADLPDPLVRHLLGLLAGHGTPAPGIARLWPSPTGLVTVGLDDVLAAGLTERDGLANALLGLAVRRGLGPADEDRLPALNPPVGVETWGGAVRAASAHEGKTEILYGAESPFGAPPATAWAVIR